MQIRNFLILLVLIPLLLIVGAGVYFFGPWPKKDAGPGWSGARALEVLISEPVISPILSFDGEKIWYMTPGGKLRRANIANGKPEDYALPEPISSPIRVIWPKSGSDFVVELGSGKGFNQYGIYQGDAKKFTYYPRELQKAAFLSDVSKIVYEWSYADGRDDLKVSDANGANFRAVTQLRRPDYEIVPSPQKNEVLLYGKDNLEASELLLVDLGTGEFKNIGEKDFYEGAKFSADGAKLLVAKSKKLMVYDLASFAGKDLGVVLNPGFTAVWGKGDGEIIVGQPDSIVAYNLATGEKRELYRFAETDKAKPGELIVHPDKNLLFFVDQNTRQLYQVGY